MEYILSTETGFGSYPDHKRSLGHRPRPSSTHIQSFRAVHMMDASMWAGIHDAQEFGSLA